MGPTVTKHSEQSPRCWWDSRDEVVQPMLASAINLAQHLIGDRTGFVLDTVFRQHGDVSETVFVTESIQCFALMWR